VLARSLIHQRSKTSGDRLGIDYYVPHGGGIEQEANELGYSPPLLVVNHPTDDHEKILDTLISPTGEGIIWPYPKWG